MDIINSNSQASSQSQLQSHSEPNKVLAVSDSTEKISTRYESRRKTVAEDLSLKEIAKIFTGNWLLFLMLLTATSMSALGIYIFRTPFVSTGSIVVNDSQNSSLQSFATQYFGLTKSVADGKKSNSPLQKHLEFLKTEEFFSQLLNDITAKSKSDELTVVEKKGYEIFRNKYLKSSQVPMTAELRSEIIQKLDAMSKLKLQSDFEISVSFLTAEKELALFLTNVALASVTQSLKEREMLEIIKVDSFIKSQLDVTQKSMNSLNSQLAEFQNKPENLMSLSSKEKVSEYLSELLVRKNEIRMKIAENQKAVRLLAPGTSKRRESQLYGNGGRVQALNLEIEMYNSKISDIQRAIDQVAYQAKSIPVAAQVYDDLKKKSEMEFNKFKDLTAAISKVEAQKLSIESRFEILEKGRFEKVVPQISLSILLMLAVLISQILGSLIIYIMYIWDHNSVTAHSSRDIVILDSHSLDPRVIIENTKIKFRMKDAEFSDGTAGDSSSRKLSFKMSNQKSSGGEDFES